MQSHITSVLTINSYTYPVSHPLQGTRSNALNNYKGVLQISVNVCLQICLNSMMKKLIYNVWHQSSAKQDTTTSTRIAIGNTNVSAVNHVCNLESLMNNTLKNQSHINNLTSTTFNQLMNIRRIHSKLDQETTRYISQSLVISKLDYCNSLLLVSADYQLYKMQWIQNMACRIVCNLCKFNHISSSMQDLHWLKNTIVDPVQSCMYHVEMQKWPIFKVPYRRATK